MITQDEKIVNENINKLVVSKNARWRTETSDLGELMESIKQFGVLQPIVVRTEDKMIIMGHRRFMASKKLGYETIPVRYMEGIDDRQAQILNLLENIQRKNISSIEIGRSVYEMLHNKDWQISLGEIAVKLGQSQNRIKTCLSAFTSLPAEFQKDVVHMAGDMSRKIGTLPENVVQAIINFNKQISRSNRTVGRLSSSELNYLFKQARDEGLTVSQISLLQHMITSNIPFKKALKMLDEYTIMRIDLIALKTELDKVMITEGTRRKQDLISRIVKEKYPNLVY